LKITKERRYEKEEYKLKLSKWYVKIFPLLLKFLLVRVFLKALFPKGLDLCEDNNFITAICFNT
jgi:hypothetical protein